MDIKVCMGSACYAKGNQENLECIKQYIEDNDLEAKVSLVGGLCENKCFSGPRIIVNGFEYCHVNQADIPAMLSDHVGKEK